MDLVLQASSVRLRSVHSREARSDRSETFREGGGKHGPDNRIDRAARRGGARRGRLGILAVAPVTLALSDLPPRGGNQPPSCEVGSAVFAPGGFDPQSPARALASPRVAGGAGVGGTQIGTDRGDVMFMTLFVVLLVAWLLGWVAFHVAGGLIHLLLVVAIISLIVHFVRGRGVTV